MKPSVLSLPSSAVAHPRKGRREAIRDPQADVEALCVRDPPLFRTFEQRARLIRALRRCQVSTRHTRTVYQSLCAGQNASRRDFHLQ